MEKSIVIHIRYCRVRRTESSNFRKLEVYFWDTSPIRLVVITSVSNVSELAALSCMEPFLVLHRDKVVLGPKPSFLPKVVYPFHLNGDIVFPSGNSKFPNSF